MAKVTDYNEIMNEVETQISQTDHSLTDYVGMETAKMIVANIYMANDTMKGFGQDIKAQLSVIASEKAIAVVHDGQMGCFRGKEPLCIYESLTDDISEILIVMQAAFDRMVD